jgi:hypothetical protein
MVCLHVPSLVAQESVVQAALSSHEAAPQHVELTQLPLPQSVPTAQVCPSASLLPQRLSTFRHVSPETQSAFVEHVVRQDTCNLLSQTYGEHDCGVVDGGQCPVPSQQWPAPSQLAAGVKALPGLGHVAARQPMTDNQGRHAPLPLHVPSFEQSPAAGSLALHLCFGSDCPLTTKEHLPTLPATLQLMQRAPVEPSEHALLQHTPSVQKPLSH